MTDDTEGLVTADPERETVPIRNTVTAETQTARVDDDGIVREAEGPTCYSTGVYELVAVAGDDG